MEGHGTATPAARRSSTATPRPGSGSAHGTTLEGILERVTYANEETAWSVVKLAVPGRRDLVTVVGNLLGVQPGENVRLRGRWTVDRRYGEQFQSAPARELRVSVNGESVGTFRAVWDPDRAGAYELAVPKALVGSGWNRLDLRGTARA